MVQKLERNQIVIRILLGNLLIACAVNGFILPGGFICGGSTGVALILDQYFGIPFDLSVYGVVLTCFIIGWICMGNRFAMHTLMSTIVYPLLISATSFLKDLQLASDPLLGSLLGGLLCGMGLALVLQSGASTGGMDIPAILANHFFKIPTSAALLVTDGLLLMMQMQWSTLSQVVFGLLIAVMTSVCMNHILTLGKSAVQIMVYSSESDKIRQLLLQRENHGVTLFEIENGYARTASRAICSVFSRKDLASVRNMIYAVDPAAFMVVSNVQEVRGMNFMDWNQRSFGDLLGS